MLALIPAPLCTVTLWPWPISFLMVSGVAATRVSPVWVSRGTPMCTSNLLHDLFAFDLFVKRPVHREWRNWGGRSARSRRNDSGARHFAGELYGHQGIMTGDEKLTTSHPVTDCRNAFNNRFKYRCLEGFRLFLDFLQLSR